jgi:predicted nucleic acid-binding protein
VTGGALVYDSGALIAAERGVRRIFLIHDVAVRQGVRPVVPVVVLAQAWRAGPQARMSQLLKGCDIVPDSGPIGRAAGELCAISKTSDVVDAIVMVTAAVRGATVVTSDPGDLAHLADVMAASVIVRSLT